MLCLLQQGCASGRVTTKEALQNLMDITTRNLRTFLDGNGEHIVNR